jgi:hypothetical protein
MSSRTRVVDMSQKHFATSIGQERFVLHVDPNNGRTLIMSSKALSSRVTSSSDTGLIVAVVMHVLSTERGRRQRCQPPPKHPRCEIWAVRAQLKILGREDIWSASSNQNEDEGSEAAGRDCLV